MRFPFSCLADFDSAVVLSARLCMRSVRRNDIMVTGNNVRAVNVNHAVVVNDDALTVFQRTCITVKTDGAY